MPKPPPTPPPSDIKGVHRDQVHRLSRKTFDAQAQRQLELEGKQKIGRPSEGLGEKIKKEVKGTASPRRRGKHSNS